MADLLVRVTKNSDKETYKDKNYMVNYEVYQKVMPIWCAFSATDINNDYHLCSKELRMLLWVYEDDRPSDYRIH